MTLSPTHLQLLTHIAPALQGQLGGRCKSSLSSSCRHQAVARRKACRQVRKACDQMHSSRTHCVVSSTCLLQLSSSVISGVHIVQYCTAPWCLILYKQHIKSMRKREMIQRYRAARYMNDLELKVDALEAVRLLVLTTCRPQLPAALPSASGSAVSKRRD